MDRVDIWLKRIKSMCAFYGIFLYLFDPPKTLVIDVSAVICLLTMIIIDIYCFCRDKQNLHFDDEKNK